MRTYDPNRIGYNKRIESQKHCEFCDLSVIRKQSCPSLGGRYWHVLAAKYPYLNGNVMIVPKRHVDQLKNVLCEEWTELQEVFKKVQSCLGRIFKTKDYNIGINIGKNSGASIKHLHWQVIPRTKTQSLTVTNLLADLQMISISGDDLRKMIEKDARH